MVAAMGIREYRAAFFDAAAVLRQIGKFERKALSKFGAFVRTRARSSVRKRKAISRPGSPPSSHEGSYKRLIFFAFDAQSRSVVIGPVQFKRGEVPRLLEHGGTVVRTGSDGKSRRLVYRPRPHIAPAGRAEQKNFPQLLRSIIS